MHNTLSKTISKLFDQRRLFLFFFILILFVFIYKMYGSILFPSSKNVYDLENKVVTNYNPFIIDRYNLNSSLVIDDPSYSELSDIIGDWYLQGYSNAKISFYPVQDSFSFYELKVSSINIGLFTLEEFSLNDSMSEISKLDYKIIKDFYSLEIIGGKMGTLLLKKDGNIKIFKRTISRNALEGIVPPSCTCLGTCQN